MILQTVNQREFAASPLAENNHDDELRQIYWTSVLGKRSYRSSLLWGSFGVRKSSLTETFLHIFPRRMEFWRDRFLIKHSPARKQNNFSREASCFVPEKIQDSQRSREDANGEDLIKKLKIKVKIEKKREIKEKITARASNTRQSWCLRAANDS